MNPADEQLIEQIQHVTQGGSRLLVTLARSGKALERNDSQRAAFLLAAVRNHPLYKGGRLAFDMLEIEDLMLAGSPVEPMSKREITPVLGAGIFHLAERLKEMGAPPQGRRMATTLRRDTDVSADSALAHAESGNEQVSTSPLPRLSLGPADDFARTRHASAARDEDSDAKDIWPDLQSSDYLYEYVVLGLLDIVGSIGMFPS
jgi:hypothetical protein